MSQPRKSSVLAIAAAQTGGKFSQFDARKSIDGTNTDLKDEIAPAVVVTSSSTGALESASESRASESRHGSSVLSGGGFSAGFSASVGDGGSRNEALSLGPEEVAEMREAFTLFDMDAADVLSLRQIKMAFRALGITVKKQEVAKMMVSVGKSPATEGLTLDEFTHIARPHVAHRDTDAKLEGAFDLFDESGTGKISFLDLRRVALELGEDIPDEELQEMLDEADRDGDSALDQAEFLRVVRMGRGDAVDDISSDESEEEDSDEELLAAAGQPLGFLLSAAGRRWLVLIGGHRNLAWGRRARRRAPGSKPHVLSAIEDVVDSSHVGGRPGVTRTRAGSSWLGKTTR